MNANEQKLYRLLCWLTLLIGLVCFFWGLGNIPLLSLNEARRAIPTQAMFASGDWLLPQLNGELYLTKPPLLYWLTTATSHLFGNVNEWSVRLPSALAAAVVVFAAYRYALRRFGPWAALFAVQVLIANATFARFARRAEIEMLLTALCFGALLAALHFVQEQTGRRWILLSYLLLGLAILTKGPVALLFVTLPLLVYALVYRETRAWQVLRNPLGWGILLLVGSSWFLAVSLQMGFDIWQTTVQRDIMEKVQGATSYPLLDYVLWIPGDFLPASLLLLAAPLATWRRWKSDQRLTVLMIAIAAPLLIFSVFSYKHTKYLLPIYPLLALLAGKRLGELMETARPAWRRVLLTLGLLMPLSYAGYFAVAEARTLEFRYVALMQFEQWIAGVRDMPVYSYIGLQERPVYYARRPIPVLDQEKLEQTRMQQPSFLLLVENDHLDAVAQVADCKVREFDPYLKRKKTLTIFGFGAACPSPANHDKTG
ncbi:MAG: glycosyltransferase family 39 protein [Azonexus sp.]|jgi:4-amino-4-deoxy-L-arabinose transferase-like glycosyltransferase|uniref:ArnT family glycosyltransferase n=1 Tax=Azonexus sp. TaxID=1872668 RepID=UPI00283073D7|nr:glycosyltransferase family 39 protein [Azonexus sp.]MDR0775994.1 glycosyltransferase family 39 protein [Azonexus sp.]